VTVEDVLEEIVGEIEDEYDQEAQSVPLVRREGGEMVIDARMTIDDVNEQLGLDLPHGDYDTVGGLVFSLFGRPPQPGERVSAGGLEFVAATMDGLRLKQIRILHRKPEPEPVEG
jgi:CBS domain containing-hemolysin-like protein